MRMAKTETVCGERPIHSIDIILEKGDIYDVQVVRRETGRDVIYVSVNGITILRMQEAPKTD